MKLASKVLRNFWQYLREVCGENDYARYRARALSRGERAITERAFYLEKLRHKYSRPCRCC